MIGWWKTWKALEAKGIMGINRRNADYVLKYNKRSLYPIVDDKIITKERAIAAGIHVPEMYGIISTEKEIEKLDDIIGGRSDFVIKPAQGAGGDGILVIADRFEERFRTISGRIISHDEIEHQISSILTGLYSLGGHRDRALIEYRVTPDQIFKSISYEGVPDIRVSHGRDEGRTRRNNGHDGHSKNNDRASFFGSNGSLRSVHVYSSRLDGSRWSNWYRHHPSYGDRRYYGYL